MGAKVWWVLLHFRSSVPKGVRRLGRTACQIIEVQNYAAQIFGLAKEVFRSACGLN